MRREATVTKIFVAGAKAKHGLGWTLRSPSWRQEFADLYAKPTAATSMARSVPANAESAGSSSR
jgi:hypothetical protein